MIYLSHFDFPHIEREYTFLMGIKRTCYEWLAIIVDSVMIGEKGERYRVV